MRLQGWRLRNVEDTLSVEAKEEVKGFESVLYGHLSVDSLFWILFLKARAGADDEIKILLIKMTMIVTCSRKAGFLKSQVFWLC